MSYADSAAPDQPAHPPSLTLELHGDRLSVEKGFIDSYIIEDVQPQHGSFVSYYNVAPDQVTVLKRSRETS